MVDLAEAEIVKRLGLRRLSSEPLSGYSPDRPLEQMHPELGVKDRLAVKAVSSDPAVAKRYLESKGFEAIHRGGQDFAVRRPGETKWRVVDPSSFELADLGDLTGDAVRLAGLIGGGLAGAALGAPSGPGALASTVAGAGAGSGAAEGLLQGAGRLLGLDPTLGEAAGAVGREAILGAGTELGVRALGTGGSYVLGKIRGRAPVEAAQAALSAPEAGARAAGRVISRRGEPAAAGRVIPRPTPKPAAEPVAAPPQPGPAATVAEPVAAAASRAATKLPKPEGPLGPQALKIRDIVLEQARRAPGMEFSAIFRPRGKPSELAQSIEKLGVSAPIRERLVQEFGADAKFRVMNATLKPPSFHSAEAVSKYLPKAVEEVRSIAEQMGIAAKGLGRPELVERIFLAQQGVIKGVGNFDPRRYGLLRPFDTDRQEWRHIPWDAVVAFRPAGGRMVWFRREAATKAEAGAAKIPMERAPTGAKAAKPPLKIEPSPASTAAAKVAPQVARPQPGRVTSTRRPQPVENVAARLDPARRLERAVPERLVGRVGETLERAGTRGAKLLRGAASLRQGGKYGALGLLLGVDPMTVGAGYMGLRGGELGMRAVAAIGRRLSHRGVESMPAILSSQTAPPAVKRLALGALKAMERGPTSYRAALYLLLQNPAFRAWATLQGAAELGVDLEGEAA